MSKKNKFIRGPLAGNQFNGQSTHKGPKPDAEKPQGSALLNGLYGTAKIAPAQPPEVEEALIEMNEDISSERRLELEENVRQQLEARAASLDDQRKQLEDERRALNEASDALIKRNEVMVANEHAFKQRETELTRLEESLSGRTASLTQREREIEARELDARNGFAIQNEQALRDLKEQIQTCEQRRISLTLEIEEELTRARERLTREIDAVRGRLAEREERLSERLAMLDARHDELEIRKQQLDSEKRSRDAMESMLRKRLEADFAADRADRERTIDKLGKRSAELSRQLSEARDELDSQAELLAALDGRAPSALLQDMQDLKHENKDLKRTVSDLQAYAATDELGAVRDERDQAKEELERLRIEVENYRQRAHSTKIAVLERERAADELRVMQQKNQVLKVHLDDLETRISKLTDSRQSAVAFPELVRMDAEPEFQIGRAIDEVRDLKTFTNELRTRLALTQPDNPLFFRIEDLQLFVGGLAMSQLHVFQGISGTGKTSLAKAFAKAVGGECQDIAVQAGWRDRSDLLGHYNTFEKRFAEKECLQALYRAATPSGRDRLNIVLLDEMNLSRPEQYFADFLSALEKERDDRWIRLVESSPPNAPRALRDGREISLPDNLWFIGTANQDETTNELADKTHDRAFVLELPRHEERFDLERGLGPKTYSFDSLNKAFKTAQESSREEIDEILRVISDSDLTTMLGDRFEIGWGNRFERQARKFLPVVKAAGGTIAQGLDHLLSTRIFRNGKVTGRYDTNRDDLENVQAELETVFRALTGGADPERCLSAIVRDIQRLERNA